MRTLRLATLRALAPLGAAFLLTASGCTSLDGSLDGTPAAASTGTDFTCPNDFHAQCPTPAPSYTTDITPIVQAHCLPCHVPNGLEPTENDFSTYDALFDDRQAVEDQINECRMPPVDAGTGLPTASRVLLLTWLACGAPNN